MWGFAWRNVLTRPARTALSVIGLSVPIFGVIGLLALSEGIRNLMGSTFSQVPGILVVRENVLSPVASDLPAAVVDVIARLPGVRVVAPAIWKLAPTIEGRSLFARSAAGLLGGGQAALRAFTEVTVIEGQDLIAYGRLRQQVFRAKLLPPERGGGRFLDARDAGKPHIVISTKIAAENPNPDGSPRRVGQTLRIGNRDFIIVGLYETGSIVLDVTIVMDIGTARELLNVGEGTISSAIVEPEDPRLTAAVVEAIERAVPEVDARDMAELNLNVGRMLGQLDLFLMLSVSLALFVGAIGIVNTMLMSTSERFVEFAILRANGWTRGDVLRMVTTESAYLGALSGVLGCVLARLAAGAINPFLGGGLQLAISWVLYPLGTLLALVMGVMGGLYPAWKAARMAPMDAIRSGYAR